MDLLKRLHKNGYLLVFWGIISMILFNATACQYPYNTRQAREARRNSKAFEKYRKAEAAKITDIDSNKTRIASDTSKEEIKYGVILPPDSTKTDTLLPPIGKIRGGRKGGPDSLVINDSLRNELPDSLALNDSLPQPYKKIIRFAGDSLAGPLRYSAKDSMIYDLSNKIIYLYGSAEVVYEAYTLEAGYIAFNFSTNIATAEGLPDSSGTMREEPFFNDGSQTFNARKIVYNFKSKKGKVYDATTEQGDGYFLSKETKFVSKEADSNMVDDVVYAGNCTYTTCNHKHPHFGIRTMKAKVIPNKMIIVGPSYLEVMGTPTPLVLPFGFFPINNQKRKSGLILSTNVDFSPTWGVGIIGMGYYQAINDHIDFSITGNVYSRGSFALDAVSNYNWRYKASGSFSASYARYKSGFKEDPNYQLQKNFKLRWTHTQAPKAHPSQTFSASVDMGTSGYNRTLTTSSVNDALQSTFQSNISYTKRFLGTPFSLSVGASHSQNTSTNVMNITLPRTTLNMNQIFPFKRKNPLGEQKWYERIGFSYSMNANNSLQIVDSLLFTPDGIPEALKDAKYSIAHSPRLNFTFKLFKYINVQPTINYKEYWYFYSNEQQFNDTLVIQFDTLYDSENNILQIDADTTFGLVESMRDYGFNAVRDLNAGINMSTQIFATGTFNILGLHKVRAVIRPNVGFSWRPDYSTDFWGYYGQVQRDGRYPEEYNSYSRFDIAPGSGKQALLTYSLNTRIEGKFKRSRRDTTSKDPYRRAPILNNVGISGNYNIAADSLKMSTISLNANTTLFKLVNATVSFVFDPYAANINDNTRINTFEWDANKRLVRMTSGSLNLSTNLNTSSLKQLFSPNKKQASVVKKTNDFEFFQGVSLNYNLRYNQRYINEVDSLMITANEISMTGKINLSKGWNIQVNRIGYDFSRKRLTAPQFTFSRNLHCWEMGMSWQPERKIWNFFLAVRPGSLGFIKVPVNKTQFDPY